jgi:hypothetical protein
MVSPRSPAERNKKAHSELADSLGPFVFVFGSRRSLSGQAILKFPT